MNVKALREFFRIAKGGPDYRAWWIHRVESSFLTGCSQVAREAVA